jgi:hypothetical protein
VHVHETCGELIEERSEVASGKNEDFHTGPYKCGDGRIRRHKRVDNGSELLYRFQEARDLACDAVALAPCIVRVYLCGK